jgi:hypothetical protein
LGNIRHTLDDTVATPNNLFPSTTHESEMTEICSNVPFSDMNKNGAIAIPQTYNSPNSKLDKDFDQI